VNNFSTIILASGKSERMGKPKALLQWGNNSTFIEQIANEYAKAGCTEIICVINEAIHPVCINLVMPKAVKFILNLHPELGRFYSIKLGISKVMSHNFCFIQNVDNPYVNEIIIHMLLAERKSDAWCSPVFNGKGGHPVLLPRAIFQKIAAINGHDLPLAEFLKNFERITIETGNDLILKNLNKPEDFSGFPD
jgi:molybdenum cofactor cytidylyltransferase